MYKEVLERINEIQEGRICSIKKEGRCLELGSGPKTKQSGLYWIYTKYTHEEMLASVSSSKRRSVNIGKITARNSELNHISHREVAGFRLVYNGIGGVGSKGFGGLRERILGEFRGGEGTGSLAICDSSLCDLSKWRYSYILWSEIEFKEAHDYGLFSDGIEIAWRIHYGWPVLCAK